MPELMAQAVLKEVYFPVPINTSSRTIDFQNKQTFVLKDMGMYASNEFQGARLNDFKKVNDSTVAVFINPENKPINNSAYYAFLLWSEVKRDIYLNFKYPAEYKHRYRPKIKTVSGVWRKLSKKNIVRNGNEAIAKIRVGKTPVLISAQELSTSKDTEKWINSLIEGKEDHVHLLSAGKSKFQRDIPVLDIYKDSKQGKPIVVLLTRQHPPEITGYFAYQFFLETILSESNLSKTFLEKYRVLAFPIVNPDGVDMGNWRHNGGGIDLNRDWSRYRQPETRNVANFIINSAFESDGEIVLGLDFHSTYKDVFYTNKTRKKTTMPNFIGDWFKALEENIPDYKVNERKNDSASANSKGWFLYLHNAVGVTYEIGDSTPKKQIELIGKVSAREMMRILIENSE
ncbi:MULTISPECIES: M14 family metallopeptidase [Flavobacteriaceae]|uniref:M14 family metallopeptidase n=1 Tax=Flavobacteriaceae TaxID=49546 RepID=UPI001490B076|nr:MULTISPECIES: M14 family metallopeptidase [Allomuricauda]MDC6366072.1 M14 family metallopeptidase [Muricauda sp. AC10]